MFTFMLVLVFAFYLLHKTFAMVAGGTETK